MTAKSRLIGLVVAVESDPFGWTTVVLTSHGAGRTLLLGSLSTTATMRPEAAAEIIGAVLIEDAFFTLPPGLRPEEN